MKQPKLYKLTYIRRLLTLGVVLAASCLVVGGAYAQVSPPPENPKSGSVGLEGTISAPPPSRAATITTPVNGRTFTELPATVNGLCPEGTMVKIFSNEIFIGSVTCANGSYSLQVDLFSGQNDLVARVFDDLDQAGPDSNRVIVTFNDAQFAAFGSRVSLSSNYARMGANPKETLSWPIIISGGAGPYALSVDWGDGKPVTLRSLPVPGNFNIDHIYDAAGVYRIVVRVTDANGTTAFLQLIGVSTGKVAASGTTTADSDNNQVVITKTKTSVIPSLVAIPLILTTFWLGRKYEMQVLRHRIERSTSGE